MKQIINISAKNSDTPTCIEKNSIPVSEPKEVATEFNNYFADIAQKIVDDRKWEGNSTFKDYWSTRNPNSLAFYQTDKDEVTKIISTFKSGKSYGPTSIPINILHLIKLEISSPLSKIINLFIETGCHPDKLKMAKVIPIYKK